MYSWVRLHPYCLIISDQLTGDPIRHCLGGTDRRDFWMLRRDVHPSVLGTEPFILSMVLRFI
jgi:hypothetical protein